MKFTLQHEPINDPVEDGSLVSDLLPLLLHPNAQLTEVLSCSRDNISEQFDNNSSNKVI